MNLFAFCFISGASFLLSFLLFFHPLQQNIKANRWLGFFAFIIGCAFASIYMIKIDRTLSTTFLFKSLTSLQFLLAPSLFVSTLYFVKPTKVFSIADGFHFLPFVVYVAVELIWNYGEKSISTFSLFAINKDVSFLVRDLLPFLTLFYLIKSYVALAKYKVLLKLTSSTINQVNLDWLVQFLIILLLIVLIWINDALFEFPLVTEATLFIYSISIFFLAYFSIRQKAIFAFKEKDMAEIATLKKDKHQRLNDKQIAALSVQLSFLMEKDKLFLDNDLNLATVADKLGVSIHEASFLINETAKDNFYSFINRYRIEEAKRLLGSPKIEDLNMLGIAFASGFNSKTTFNTTFKKMVGISPSQYIQQQKNSKNHVRLDASEL
jgi:AraC-like DNA-binding protein